MIAGMCTSQELFSGLEDIKSKSDACLEVGTGEEQKNCRQSPCFNLVRGT